MKLIKVYKLLTYFLTIPTAIIALFTLVGILVGIANPSILLDVFITACSVIYFISSFIFLNRIILSKKTCKKIIKDLIRINGFISIFFAVKIIMGFLALLVKPSLLQQMVTDAMTQNATAFPPDFNKEMFIKLAWFFMSAISVYAIALLVHIMVTFKLAKENIASFISE